MSSNGGNASEVTNANTQHRSEFQDQYNEEYDEIEDGNGDDDDFKAGDEMFLDQ